LTVCATAGPILTAARNQHSTLALLACFQALLPAICCLMLASRFWTASLVLFRSPFFNPHAFETPSDMAIGTRLGLGPRDRHIIIKDSLLADGVKQSDDADPTDSEGSIHTTRDGAKEMEALLRSLTHPSSVCACPIRGRTVGGRTNRTSMAAKSPSVTGEAQSQPTLLARL
jgi:hypothetical protein